MQTMLWLIIFAILLVIEIITLGLTTIWFALGAIAAFLAAYIGFGTVVQVIVFLVVSVVLFVLTRPIAVKFFNQERERTNAESLIGQRAIVKEAIHTLQGIGKVEVNGMEWSAKTDESESIEAGSVVLIKGIQGVKLIVEKEEA